MAEKSSNPKRGPILIGSSNPHKIQELRALMRELGLELLSPLALASPPPKPKEEGQSFLEVARGKALAYARATGLWTLADDSGLEVDALSGRPGIHSARFAGPNATDADNNRLLLESLAGLQSKDRRARFVAAVALATPQGILLAARATCAGVILHQPRGSDGFGYDPLFWVPKLRRSLAELTREEKGRVSHRGQAWRKIRLQIENVLGGP